MTGASQSRTTGIILLAAGETGRWTALKEPALFRGKPLLRHAAETALSAGLGPVNVVISAADQHSRNLLRGLEVNIFTHHRRPLGAGGAIATGIRPWLGRKSRPDGVIVLPANQPGVTPAHLQALVEAAALGLHSIVATTCGSQPEAPAWFAGDKFFRLLLLEGKDSMKTLIAREPRLHRVELPATVPGGGAQFILPIKLSTGFGNDRPRPRAA